MYPNFIEKVIEELLEKNNDLSKFNIIIPGRRPIVFFKRYLIKKGYNGFLPTFYTIEDFIYKHTTLVKIENIPLWLEAFHIQKKFINAEERLDEFLKWIPTLLKDFNDIEIFSENPQRVLEHMASIERIENWVSKLDSNRDKKLYYKNLKFWENNLILYNKLTEALENNGLGTYGMILNRVINNLTTVNIPNHEIFVFVGLNALTPKEEKLIKHYISHSETYLYWDADNYYLNDNNQEAGYFLRKYKNWNYYATRDFKWVGDEFNQKKNIHVVSTSQDVAQGKYISSILNSIPEEDLHNTALVLSDESILPVILGSIPENITRVNITMGFPLKNSFLASFFKQIFQLHIFREKNKAKGFYYRDILSLLQNPLIHTTLSVNNFICEIKKNNLIYISDALIYERLGSFYFYFIFKEYGNPVDLVHQLYEYCTEQFWKTNSDHQVLKENYLKFKNLFSVLQTQLSQNISIQSYSLLYTFYQHIISNESIDFIGEPVDGLQIMGVLETRLLNFKNVIISGVNEGILPGGKNDNSFIPFDVRKNYGMNTFLENDAIYAYHFYRLLQHAQNITLIYNNFTEGINSGEKSRFISQLELESKHTIIESVATYGGNLKQSNELIIEKSPAIINSIHEWLKNPISPTHLIGYYYNPINFYLRKILKINEQQEMEEEISALNYGNLIHHTLESIYSPLQGNKLTEKDLLLALKNYSVHLNKYIKKELNPDLFKKGQNYLQKLLAEKTIEKILLRDLTDIKNGNVIFLKEIEKELVSTIDLPKLGTLTLKGFIDRWDSFNNEDRIIDYKTTSIDKLKFESDKFDKIQENKNFKFFIQLVFYAYMVLHEKLSNSVKVGIWSFKKPFHGLEILQIDSSEKLNESQAKILFEEVAKLISEIADPTIPLVEKSSFIKF
ncbi:MAG: PD-(D/E)XK nuclease family protein [Apibacter sp.]|nr:PD-(D/E)XK nuclease family protein [Apibacter sp.]